MMNYASIVVMKKGDVMGTPEISESLGKKIQELGWDDTNSEHEEIIEIVLSDAFEKWISYSEYDVCVEDVETNLRHFVKIRIRFQTMMSEHYVGKREKMNEEIYPQVNELKTLLEKLLMQN